MKIGSPKNLKGKDLLVGVSAVDSNGSAIGSDITTLKQGANVTMTSSAGGVVVIGASIDTSDKMTTTSYVGNGATGVVNSATSAASASRAVGDKNGNDITTTYQTVIDNSHKISGAYVSGAVSSATNATTVNGLAVSASVPANAVFTDTIPGSAVITISAGGTSVGSFTANESSNKSVNIPAATSTSYGVVKVETVVSNTANAVANSVVSAVSSAMSAHIASAAIHATVGNATITLKAGGTSYGSFTVNTLTNTSADIPVATDSSFGVVKVGSGVTVSSGVISVVSQGGVKNCATAVEANAFLTIDNEGQLLYFSGETDSVWSNGHLYLLKKEEASGLNQFTATGTGTNGTAVSGTYTIIDSSKTGYDRSWKNDNGWYIGHHSSMGWLLVPESAYTRNSGNFQSMGSDSNRQIIAEDPIGTWPNSYTGGVNSFVTTQVAGQTVAYDLLGGSGDGASDIITCTTTAEAAVALAEENDGKLIYYTGTTESPWTNGHLYLVQAGSSPIEVVTLTVTASNTYTSTTESYSGTYNLVDASATGANRVWTNGNFNIKYDSSNSYWYITPATGTESRRFTNTASSTSIPSGNWNRVAEMLGSLSNTYTTSSSVEVNAVDLLAGGSSGSGLPEISTISDAEAFCVAANEGKAFLYTGETTAATESRHYLELSVSGSNSSSYTQYAGNYYLYSGNANDTTGVWKREDADYAIKFVSATGWYVYSSPTGSQVFQISSSSASNPTTAFATASSYGFGYNRTATTQYHLGNGTMGATLGHIYLVVEGTEAGTIGTYLAQDLSFSGEGVNVVFALPTASVSTLGKLYRNTADGKLYVGTLTTTTASVPAYTLTSKSSSSNISYLSDLLNQPMTKAGTYTASNSQTYDYYTSTANGHTFYLANYHTTDYSGKVFVILTRDIAPSSWDNNTYIQNYVMVPQQWRNGGKTLENIASITTWYYIDDDEYGSHTLNWSVGSSTVTEESYGFTEVGGGSSSVNAVTVAADSQQSSVSIAIVSELPSNPDSNTLYFVMDSSIGS